MWCACVCLCVRARACACVFGERERGQHAVFLSFCSVSSRNRTQVLNLCDKCFFYPESSYQSIIFLKTDTRLICAVMGFIKTLPCNCFVSPCMPFPFPLSLYVFLLLELMLSTGCLDVFLSLTCNCRLWPTPNPVSQPTACLRQPTLY